MREAMLLALTVIAPPQQASGAIAPSSRPPPAVPMGRYRLDPDHASVVAKVRCLGLLHYALRFSRLEGRYEFDPAHSGAFRLSVDVDAHSFDDEGDGAARQVADDILDAGRHPRVLFSATAIRPGEPGHATVTGDLTLRGVTRPVTLKANWRGPNTTTAGGQPLDYSATTVIRRSDFGSISWAGVVGDQVQLTIDARFVNDCRPCSAN